MEANRPKIPALICADHDTADIVKKLGVNHHTVDRFRKHLEEGDSLKDRPHSGRLTKLTLEATKTAFKANSKMSMTEFAKEKSMARSSVSSAIKAAGEMSRRYVERPLLTQKHQELWVEHCCRLLNDLKHHGGSVTFFANEMTFMVDSVVNKQNDRVVCFKDMAEELCYITTTKHPAFVMMLGVIASTGDKMAPVWWVPAHCGWLLGDLADQGASTDPDHQEVREVVVRIPTGQHASSHSQCSADMDDQEHDILAQ